MKAVRALECHQESQIPPRKGFSQSTLASRSLATRRRNAVGERFATPLAAATEKRMYEAPWALAHWSLIPVERSLSVASIPSGRGFLHLHFGSYIPTFESLHLHLSFYIPYTAVHTFLTLVPTPPFELGAARR